MEDVLSLVDERGLVGSPDPEDEIHWGVMGNGSPNPDWPVSNGKWIVTPGGLERNLSLPDSMRLYAVVPLFEDSERAAAAIMAVLYGWKVKDSFCAASDGKDVDPQYMPLAKGLAYNQGSPEPDGSYEKKHGGFEILTGREIEVAKLVSEGQPNKSISGRLGISESTVKYHIRSLFKKLGAQNRAQLVYQLARRGIIVI